LIENAKNANNINKYTSSYSQGRRQKIFHGAANGKNDRKLAKNTEN